MNIVGEYPSYCFNEACMFLMQYLEDGKELKFPTKKQPRKHYHSISEYYSNMGVNV